VVGLPAHAPARKEDQTTAGTGTPTKAKDYKYSSAKFYKMGMDDFGFETLDGLNKNNLGVRIFLVVGLPAPALARKEDQTTAGTGTPTKAKRMAWNIMKKITLIIFLKYEIYKCYNICFIY